MRLIDADELKKQIAGMAIVNNYSVDKANKICELIDCQPTAYDVEMVAKELRGKVHLNCYEPADLGYDKGMRDAAKIVKAGGLSNIHNKQVKDRKEE